MDFEYWKCMTVYGNYTLIETKSIYITFIKNSFRFEWIDVYVDGNVVKGINIFGLHILKIYFIELKDYPRKN